MSKWGEEIAAAVTGVLIGGLLFAGVGFGFKALKTRTGAELETPVEILSAPQLLIEAVDGDLVYRASSINLQDGSPLQRAIMAEQSASMAATVKQAESERNPPILVEVIYTRTASAGPITSLLKTRLTTRENGREDTEYAATLFNNIAGPGFDLADIFKSDEASEALLNEVLCDEVKQARRMRIGLVPGDVCDGIDFLNGPPTVFLQSRNGNEIGGIRFYFEAGRMGRRKEGDYVITLPQSVFRKAVRPEYLSLFGGEPDELS